MHIRIGTRASSLALAQTNLFIGQLQQKLSFTYEIIKIVTSGDKIKDKPLYDIGGKALFLKEIEEALLRNEIDCAVHSMKDVPGELPPQLCIAAVLERANPFDILISKNANNIIDLPYRAKIATSSPRRRAEILRLRPDIIISDIRGNIQTRLDKWENSDLDGTILAAAGLERLGLLDPKFCHVLSPQEMIPAVGQGVIGIEIRKGDLKMEEVCAYVQHAPTWHLLQAERGFLEYLDANCRVPLAAFARYNDDMIEVDYMLSSLSSEWDMEYYFTTNKKIDVDSAYNCGASAAEELQMRIKTT
ncbi:MAG: hydroxymethylbilane synthase [Pseudomonadota bacterium]